MISDDSKSVIARAKAIYDESLRQNLEAKHQGQFVAIEPDSGEHFVASTFDKAVQAAKAQRPGKVTHTIRIGHAAAFHVGVMHS